MGASSSFFDAFTSYLKNERRLSEHTILAYQGDLSSFFTFLSVNYSDLEIAKVKHQHVRSWMVSLLQQGQTARSINRKVSSLRSFFKFLQKQGDIASNPCAPLQALKIPKRLPSFVRESDILKLDGLPWQEDFSGLRDRLIVELLYSTGMRRAEMIALVDEDVDRSRGVLKVIGKGKKTRQIPLPVRLIEKVDSYIALRDQEFVSSVSDRLLVTDAGKALYPKMVYNCVRKYLSTITTQADRSPHVLRHSFATHLSDHGADINALKNLLGHANLAATQIYTHNSAEKLKQVYKQAHPKSGQ